MSRTPKQLSLPEITQPERPPLALDGEPGVSFEINDAPWPMPVSQPTAAEKRALLRVWVRIKDALL